MRKEGARAAGDEASGLDQEEVAEVSWVELQFTEVRVRWAEPRQAHRQSSQVTVTRLGLQEWSRQRAGSRVTTAKHKEWSATDRSL